MSFERIENCRNGQSSAAVPVEGLRVCCRKVARRKGEGLTRYIKVSIGPMLAHKMVLRGEETKLAVAFGSDNDAGKIRLSVDVNSGDFPAKRDKRGGVFPDDQRGDRRRPVQPRFSAVRDRGDRPGLQNGRAAGADLQGQRRHAESRGLSA